MVQTVSEALGCPFYKAKAYDKAAVLQDWVQSGHGWIVATGALGTGVNISGTVYVIHVDRPYGMTSFVQQSGRGGRNGEVSDSVVFVGVQTTRGWRRSGGNTRCECFPKPVQYTVGHYMTSTYYQRPKAIEQDTM